MPQKNHKWRKPLFLLLFLLFTTFFFMPKKAVSSSLTHKVDFGNFSGDSDYGGGGGGVITVTNEDWALNHIKGISQQTS